MAQINVTINGRSFRMACDDGEEEHLLGLAKRFDTWIGELREAFGEIGDQRLTVMAGIMATDQLAEIERKVARMEKELAGLRDNQRAALDGYSRRETETTEAIAAAAEKISQLADSLTKTLKAEYLCG